MNNIVTWHILIMGFAQSKRRLTGIEKLWQRLRDINGDRSELLLPQRWNADFKAIAQFIDRNRADSFPPNVSRVDWFKQREDTPQATSLVKENRDTEIASPITLALTHDKIDDASQFHDIVIHNVREMAGS